MYLNNPASVSNPHKYSSSSWQVILVKWSVVLIFTKSLCVVHDVVYEMFAEFI